MKMTIETRITYQCLMNKSKHDLAHMVLWHCDIEEDLIALLNQIASAITFENEEQAKQSPYGLPKDLAEKIDGWISHEDRD